MKNKKILIVAAHPDDETLGCGGTIDKLSKKKCKFFALFFTDGVSARGKNKNKEAKLRKKNSLNALKVLGVKKTRFLSYPDNSLDKVPLIKIIKENIAAI